MFVYFFLCLCVPAAELEFVQIILILLLVTVLMVVIICLLNHYSLPALAFISQLSHTQRDQATQTVCDFLLLHFDSIFNFHKIFTPLFQKLVSSLFVLKQTPPSVQID